MTIAWFAFAGTTMELCDEQPANSATVHLNTTKLSPHHSPSTKREMSWNAATF
jgi:hypothetical protein